MNKGAHRLEAVQVRRLEDRGLVLAPGERDSWVHSLPPSLSSPLSLSLSRPLPPPLSLPPLPPPQVRRLEEQGFKAQHRIDQLSADLKEALEGQVPLLSPEPNPFRRAGSDSVGPVLSTRPLRPEGRGLGLRLCVFAPSASALDLAPRAYLMLEIRNSRSVFSPSASAPDCAVDAVLHQYINIRSWLYGDIRS